MLNLLAIGVGGALGAVLRYAVASGVHALVGRSFPFGTLVVNALGSFAMGLFSVLLVERLAVGPHWRAALLVGLLGAFTTFSTFSMETLTLLEQGAAGRAGLNIAGNLLLCLGMAWLGLMIGRQV